MGHIIIKRGGGDEGKVNIETFDIWQRIDSATGRVDGPYPTSDTLILHKELPARHPWHGLRLLSVHSGREIGETRGPGLWWYLGIFLAGGLTERLYQILLYVLNDANW